MKRAAAGGKSIYTPSDTATYEFDRETHHAAVRNGVEAWERVQACLRQLGNR